MNQQEYEFYELGPVWHLCTPGTHQCAIFRSREDYVFGMNLVALTASSFRDEVKILTFELMSNHFHFVLACQEPTLNVFFDFRIIVHTHPSFFHRNFIYKIRFFLWR